MYLYRRGRIWWIQYMIDGVLHRTSTHTENKKIAQSWCENIAVAKRAPTFEDAVQVLRIMYSKKCESSLKLSEAWETYESIAKSIGKLNIRPKSLRDRRCDFGHFVEWAKKNTTTTTVAGVTGSIAVAYVEALARDPAKKSHTRKNIISNLSSIWKMLEKSQQDIKNPWANIAPTITDGRRIECFSTKQEKDVLNAAKTIGKDWYPVCIIALHTGLRYGSIARMTWNDVDLDKRIIHIKPSKTERYDIAVELPIIKPIYECLKDIPKTNEYLFPLHAELYGSHTKAKYNALNFREVLNAAGISGNFTFHSWRHTAATRLSKAGADIETRKKILGHTQDHTASRYDHDKHLETMKKAMEAAAKIV